VLMSSVRQFARLESSNFSGIPVVRFIHARTSPPLLSITRISDATERPWRNVGLGSIPRTIILGAVEMDS
jgi:hypothetical protein